MLIEIVHRQFPDNLPTLRSALRTQKIEFRSGVSLMRPGALLTVTVSGESYVLLFLHVASGDDPRGLGLRDDMLLRACDFRKVLDAVPAANGQANYIFLGAFNLMGMAYTFVRDRDISPANELVRLENEAARSAMRILPKDAPATWSNGLLPARARHRADERDGSGVDREDSPGSRDVLRGIAREQEAVSSLSRRQRGSVIQTIPQLLSTLASAGWSDDDLASVRRAHDLASELFSAQYRPDGKPFVDHLVGTAAAVAQADGRRDGVLAALLHAAYFLGDFGDGRRGATQKRRAELRSVIGVDAERVVFQYSQESHDRTGFVVLAQGVDDASAATRDVVLIRIANEIDDHEALGYRYRGVSAAAIAGDPVVQSMIDTAVHIDCPHLADRLRAAIEAEEMARIPPELVQSTQSHTAMPRSARRRLGPWYRVDQGRLARAVRGARSRVPWRLRRW